MLLSQLPDQVLAKIVSAVYNSTAVIQLWTCGNLLLNTRLARGGCVEFIMKHKDAKKRRLPSVLGSLKALRTVRIQAWELGDYQSLILTTLQTMSHLVELRLVMMYANWVLLDRSSAADGSMETLLHESRVYGAIALTKDIAAMFPVLETLHLNDRTSTETPPIGAQSFALLPPRLTYLQWGACITDEAASPHDDSAVVGYSLLPRSLTYLRLDMFLSMDHFETLPPGLITFKGRFMTFSEEQLRALPRTLTNFGKYLDLPHWSNQIASALPPGLLRLPRFWIPEAPSLDHRWIRTLPQHLTRLSLHPYNLTPIAIAALPRTLLHLEWVSFDEASFAELLSVLPPQTDLLKNVVSWPPRLHTLTNGFKIDSMPISSLLPRSITKISDLSDKAIAESVPLPSGLISLTLSSQLDLDVSYGTFVPIGCPMPESLLIFHAVPISDNRSLVHLNFLPSRLTDLSMSNELTEIDAELLPRTLRKLVTGSVSFEAFASLPPLLEKLTCYHIHSETQLPDGSYYDDSSLTNSQMQEDGAERILRDCSAFGLLPYTLRRLCIDTSKFHADILRHLPSYALTDLNLNISLPVDEMDEFWPSLPLHAFKWVEDLLESEVRHSAAKYRALHNPI